MTARRGFTLIDILIALMLFTAISVILMRFVTRVVGVMHSAPVEAANQLRVDQAIDAIRQSVEASMSVQTPSPQELVLEQFGRASVRWRCGTDHRLWELDSHGRQQDFGVFPGAFHFAGDGAVVRVTVDDAKRFGGGHFSLPCPAKLEDGS